MDQDVSYEFLGEEEEVGKLPYVPPTIEVIEVKMEKGFANSGGRAPGFEPCDW